MPQYISIGAGVLVIAIIVLSLWIIQLQANTRRLQARAKLWRRRYQEQQRLLQPMIDYIMYCEQVGQYVSEDGLRAFLAGRNIDYDIWINQQQVR